MLEGARSRTSFLRNSKFYQVVPFAGVRGGDLDSFELGPTERFLDA